jgi:hypothetical protein
MHFVNVVSLAVSHARGVQARGQVMSSVASAAARGNKVPFRPRKFTPENIARIKDWVAQGVGRDEIANRLEVTIGSLQVTCSKLGISLRKGSSANGNGAIQSLGAVQSSIDHTHPRDHPARPKFTLLIQKQSRQAAFDLPLNQNLIEQLALEASVRALTIGSLIGKILTQAMEKHLPAEIPRNGNSSSKG